MHTHDWKKWPHALIHATVWKRVEPPVRWVFSLGDSLSSSCVCVFVCVCLVGVHMYLWCFVPNMGQRTDPRGCRVWDRGSSGWVRCGGAGAVSSLQSVLFARFNKQFSHSWLNQSWWLKLKGRLCEDGQTVLHWSARDLARTLYLCPATWQAAQRAVKFLGYLRWQQREGRTLCCYFWSGGFKAGHTDIRAGGAQTERNVKSHNSMFQLVTHHIMCAHMLMFTSRGTVGKTVPVQTSFFYKPENNQVSWRSIFVYNKVYA